MTTLKQKFFSFMPVKSAGLGISCPVFPGLRLTTLFGLTLLLAVQHANAQSDAQRGADQDPDNSTIIARDVIAEEGDTLRSIALSELGRVGFASMLAEFNNLVESAPLISGDTIRIPIHVPARGEFAEAVFVKGNVTVTRDAAQSQVTANSAASASENSGTAITLERNAQILSGDTITTGPNGYVSIFFSTGSVVNIQPRTTATLQRLNCLPSDDSCLIEIITEDGQISSDVERRGNQPVEFRISTPYASAAVRGTIFDMDASENLKVGVTEGSVSVSAQAETTGLDTGFGVVVQPGEVPSEPIALLPAPVFKRVPARVAPGDTVAWWPFPNAQGYGAKLSTDEAALETFESFEVDQDTIGFDDDIASGDYYLTLRAVDANGLRGFTSNIRLTIASIDPEVEPVTTLVNQENGEYLVTVENGPENASGYEIQIANDQDFSDPLSVDVNEKGSAIFRLDDARVFARARVLLDPYTVSAFGESTSSDGQ